MKKEEKNIKEMLELIADNKNLLEQKSVDLTKYEHLNLCEDYKAFLQHVSDVHFGDLGVIKTYTEEENVVGYLYQQIYSMHTPGDSFEDDEYANKLFYEIGSAYNGDSLVQIHTGKYRGHVMMTDHEVWCSYDELVDNYDIEGKSFDEVIDILLEEGQLMSFESIGIENAADFFIKKMKALPKLENKNINQMLALIAEKKNILKKDPVDIEKYEKLNLCEDYKTFLQEIGSVNFKEIGVTKIAENVEDSSSPLIFNNIAQLHKPANNFAEADKNENYPNATGYTSKLFYEIGSDGSDGSCLVQIHTGKYRGMVMYAEYGEFPLDGELEEEFGPTEKKTADEIIDYLMKNYGCFSNLKDIDIENLADFFIKKLSTIPLYEKPATVPAEAVWVDKDKQWELGQKNAEGKAIGDWKWWAAPAGNVCGIATYEGNGNMTFTRFHTDGTVSQKGQNVDNKQTGVWIWQASKNPTTENWLSGAIFRCEAEYDNGVMLWVKYWNKEGEEIDGYGKPLKS